MKKIIFVLFSTVLFINCSPDSSSSTATGGNKIRKIEKLSNGVITLTTDYVYNGEGNLEKITSNDNSKIYKTTFTYNNDILMNWVDTETYTSGFDIQYTETNTVEFVNAKISNVCIDRLRVSFGDETHDADRIDFDYDTDQPSSIQHYYPETFDFGDSPTCADVVELNNTETFEYTNNNMTFYDSGASGFFGEYYYTYEYDTKNHHQSNIKPDVFRNCFGYSTVNNITKGYEYIRDTNVLNATITYEHTYNNDNYPTKTIKKYFTVGSTTPDQTTEFRYYYY